MTAALKLQPVKERPILFSGPMVRAILEGRKTQTRRVVKPQPVLEKDGAGGDVWTWKHNEADCPRWPDGTGMRWERFGCPYGRRGELLWVRETFQRRWATDKRPTSAASPKGWNLVYVATEGVQELHDEDRGLVATCVPSIHMPRWASRIDLEVTDVRAERLQDISEEDAKAEGVEWTDPPGGLNVTGWRGHRFTFGHLWDSINGEDAWVANPWVWVVGFKRVRP